MATVYLGRMHGAVGFTRVVALKRLHPQFATDPEFAAMFLDEARLAGRARHPNVVATLDAVAHEDELFLVMELVVGSSIAQLAKQVAQNGIAMPLEVWSAVMSGALQGLHAAHEARDELGNPLGIIHRDVSPQNILVGLDGVARMIDFGVAKAIGQTHHTREGHIKGKLGYMAPEQLLGAPVDSRVDIFAAGVVLWELLTAHRLFFGSNEGAIIRQVLEAEIPIPSSFNPDVSPELDAVVLRALDREPERRFATAAEMAAALEEALPPFSPMQVADWVRVTDGERLNRFIEDVAAVESMSFSGTVEVPAAAAVPVATESIDSGYVMAPPRGRRSTLVVGLGAAALALGLGAWGFAKRAPAREAEASGLASSTGIPVTSVAPPASAPTPSPPTAVRPSASADDPSADDGSDTDTSGEPIGAHDGGKPQVHRPVHHKPPAPRGTVSPTPLYSRD